MRCCRSLPSPPSSDSARVPLETRAKAPGPVAQLEHHIAQLPSAQATVPPGPALLAPALSPAEYRALRLLSNEPVTHNTYLLRFELPSDHPTSGLVLSSCVLIRLGGEEGEFRPYTPVSLLAQRGHLDFLIKRYPNGKMTPRLTSLQVGDCVEMKGPFKKFDCAKNTRRSIGMVAGGTGITPMLQILRECLREVDSPHPDWSFSVVYCNVSEEDIMLRSEIDAFALSQPERFRVFHLLDNPPPGWTDGAGRVDEAVLRERLPPPGPDAAILVCGPNGMMESVSGLKESKDVQGPLGGLLKQIGYDETQVFKF